MNEALEKRMESLRVREEDLVERFVHGSGPGGQKINKTASCVYLLHLPTKIEVHCQESRSRSANREIARARLCEHLEKREQRRRLERDRRRALARYAKRKPSKAQKARIRKLKKHRSEKKGFRKKVNRDD